MSTGGSYDKLRIDTLVGIEGQTFSDVVVKELMLGESLLTPGLQTAVTLQSFVYSSQPKIWGDYKNKPLTISMNQPEAGYSMEVSQQLYRIDNRELDFTIGQTETLTLHACDQSLLNDAQSLVSKSWKCTMPSDIVNYVLQSCAGAQNAVVDNAGPARDYIAENIHPFQVVAQQANVALYEGNDPSFLHYMTYEDLGTHYFRALGKLIKQSPILTFSSSQGTSLDFATGGAAISFSFPCDFDYLSDLLNGIDASGNPINTLSTINPFNQAGSLYGGNIGSCGIGKGNHKTAITNSGSAHQQNGCEMSVEQYLLLRQARMGLLEKDKIALRMTVPWNPNLHVGQVIGFHWGGKSNSDGASIYGSGSYLIVALKHNIQLGGYGTTTVDCITGNIG
jgi:hypothetical protein